MLWDPVFSFRPQLIPNWYTYHLWDVHPNSSECIIHMYELTSAVTKVNICDLIVLSLRDCSSWRNHELLMTTHHVRSRLKKLLTSTMGEAPSPLQRRSLSVSTMWLRAGGKTLKILVNQKEKGLSEPSPWLISRGFLPCPAGTVQGLTHNQASGLVISYRQASKLVLAIVN